MWASLKSDWSLPAGSRSKRKRCRQTHFPLPCLPFSSLPPSLPSSSLPWFSLVLLHSFSLFPSLPSTLSLPFTFPPLPISSSSTLLRFFRSVNNKQRQQNERRASGQLSTEERLYATDDQGEIEVLELEQTCRRNLSCVPHLLSPLQSFMIPPDCSYVAEEERKTNKPNQIPQKLQCVGNC
mmetsp:Transcript_30153/g.68231  ORF Transcript_30153/g.68231 Transcript_30153/m.68231 type:complete len:181 (-) Transcript_30153:524-1066(-)